jgi:uncharacterized RDD family membrane protein YckC
MATWVANTVDWGGNDMKCPKCGFQSFNYLPNCKKCGRDLSEIRDKYRLGDPVLPQQYRVNPMAGPAQPVVDDPFETTLPDEKDISNAVNLDRLPDSEIDADLADYFDEINAIDPELAATLDPDPDWTENAVTMERFGLGGDRSGALVQSGEEPVSEVGPAQEDFLKDVEPVAKVDEAFDPLEATQLSSDLDFLSEEDTSLDDWLLDGDEPSWRRSAASIPAEEAEELLSADTDDAGLDAINAPERPDDPAGVFSPEPEELPCDNSPEPAVQRAPLAGRLLAVLLDAGLLTATLALFVVAGEYLRRGEGVFAWPNPQDLAAHTGPYFLVFFGLAFGYFSLFHYLGGQTPGKMACKLLVVDLSGEPLQLSQVFLRSVGGLICLLPAGLGFCSVLFNREGRGWNDRLAGSVVVSVHEGGREN